MVLFEADPRLGGHSHTVEAAGTPVDTGFIVYNERTYPHLTELFTHLGVVTKPSDMSFSVSLDGGRLEYAGSLAGLFAQARNVASPRFWSMLKDLERFYRRAPRDLQNVGTASLGDYLDGIGCGAAFRDDHLYPMAAAIWSTPTHRIPDYPAAAFIRFCENHGLLRFLNRPAWRTVDGGSREYVNRLAAGIRGQICLGRGVKSIRRNASGVTIATETGTDHFDHVVIAAHADQALSLLDDPDPHERELLGAFRYRSNEVILHADPGLMPQRSRVWSSWNYVSEPGEQARQLSVTYWMNRLQSIRKDRPMFLTLNPIRSPRSDRVYHVQTYDHPMFDAAASKAQLQLWTLQGRRDTWFCGSYFGAGFHEDGLQSGLAVAERLGGVERPWATPSQPARIHWPARAPEVA